MNTTNGNMYTLKPRTQGKPTEVGCLGRHRGVLYAKWWLSNRDYKL